MTSVRTRFVAISMALAGVLSAVALVASPAQATDTGNNGCTPGYWKNHTDSWEEYDTTQLLGGDVHPNGVAFFSLDADPAYAKYKNVTFLQGLSLRGGTGLDGATQVLMRATVAAFLNAAHEFGPAAGDGYPYRRFSDTGILATVNAALESRDRAQLIAVATWLDDANNLGCPLN